MNCLLPASERVPGRVRKLSEESSLSRRDTLRRDTSSGTILEEARPPGRVRMLLGITPWSVEMVFQAEQQRAVVWVRSLEWCPPLLALIRGKAHAKFLDLWGLAVFLTWVLGMAVCNTALHMGRLGHRYPLEKELEDVGLAEASIMSGWLLVFWSSILLDAIPFHHLLRLGSFLVACTVLIHHEYSSTVVGAVCAAFPAAPSLDRFSQALLGSYCSLKSALK
jgi:hypothetical protein